LAGGIAACLTTPLDVVKTRIMLSEKKMSHSSYKGAWKTLKRIYVEEGINALWSGALPRTLWISLGGAIFFGVYEQSKKLLSKSYIFTIQPDRPC
jgi:solute carrier family 25 S-adenosylmethionine transporter 26